ncbi:MAG: GNAT family N-acetyltransferase [Betaproteobacteria bacterium]
MKIIPITNAVGDIIELEWLRQAEAVHRQLRPHLQADYVARIKQVLAGGAEMAVATRDGAVVGLVVFRVDEKTFNGRDLYCDDLVTDETKRSSGVGQALMHYMEALAIERGCDTFSLDSGTQRTQAHKFYFREGMTIAAFVFAKAMKP